MSAQQSILKKIVTVKGETTEKLLEAVEHVEKGETRYYISKDIYVPESILGHVNTHTSDNGKTTTRWQLVK